ncbi:UNVERIFIED_CONTAM: hypothetical protein GTU68_066286 [Idotea baltica]|nr:hypothetical protein [Idotea baltica]
MGDIRSGIKTLIIPFMGIGKKLSVFCDQTTDGGGWTVIQRRADLPQREEFYRGWRDYQLGFGNLTGEFWLGLDNIHALVSQTRMELRVTLEDFEGDKRWVKYDRFYIEDSAGKYRLKLGDYTNNTGESLSYHNNQQFSTKYADNDRSGRNCAEEHRGAWWYKDCSYSNLNGFPFKGFYSPSGHSFKGIVWHGFRGHTYSLKTTLLSVRPRNNK